MIDLTKKALPNTVVVNGRAYSIYTDYRVWMKFENSIKDMELCGGIDIGYIFKNERPYGCDIRDLLAFSRPQSELPRPIRESNVIVLDYRIDSDLIYSAFLGQYGIDLVDIEELHWHKFLALLGGLNESTKLREVMGYRCYNRENDKSRDVYEELKQAWSITTKEEQAELGEFNAAFGG